MANPNGPPPEVRGPAFSKENQPAGRGRPKGSRDRATIFRELLELAAVSGLSKDKSMLPAATVADQIAVALIERACGGDVYAAREALDSAYGKLVDEQKLTLSTPAQVQRIKDDAYNEPDKPLPGEPGAIADGTGSEPAKLAGESVHPGTPPDNR